MLTKITALQIGNEFRVRPGAKAAGMESIKYMEEAQKRGQDIYGVVIPYQHIRRFNLDDCFLFNGLPTWEAIKNSRDLKAKLARQRDSPEDRTRAHRLRRQARVPRMAWLGSRRVRASRKTRAEKTRTEKRRPKSPASPRKQPVDAFFDIWLEDNLQLADSLSWPRQRSSGAARRDDQVRHQPDRHRRGRASGSLLLARRADQNPGLLAPREKSLQPRSRRCTRLTGFPAKKTAPQPRSCCKEGMPADITVFDADKIDDLVSKKLPDMVDAQEVKRHPPGMKAVLVNGSHGGGRRPVPRCLPRQSAPPAALHAN